MQKSKTILLLGSSRSNGDTRKICDFIIGKTGLDLVDLNEVEMSYYDYEHRNAADDFLPLMENIAENYERIIFATPIYWYSMSAVMKTFFDRISDLLTIRKELGRKLRGKSMGLISCSGDDDVDYDFEMPFRLSAKYLGLTYLGHSHTWMENGEMAEAAKEHVLKFVEK